MRTRHWIPVGGLLATIAAAAYMVVQLNAQSAAQTGDLTQAAIAQVKNAEGQIVLEGKFMPPVEEDGGLERRARLMPTGVDTDASGEAEVEFAKGTPTEQEVEFSVEHLAANAAFTFMIDGIDIASAKSDRRGRADVELIVRMPAAAGSR